MIHLTPAGVAPPPCGIVVAIGAGREEVDTSRVVEQWAKVTVLDRARAAS